MKAITSQENFTRLSNSEGGILRIYKGEKCETNTMVQSGLKKYGEAKKRKPSLELPSSQMGPLIGSCPPYGHRRPQTPWQPEALAEAPDRWGWGVEAEMCPPSARQRLALTGSAREASPQLIWEKHTGGCS